MIYTYKKKEASKLDAGVGGGAKNQQSALKNEELKRGPCGKTEALYEHESEAISRVRI